ncbi:PTS system protein [Klebsiella pneumoniae]|nr:PTS system protein [Klebsiella pneumoniae]
MRNDWLWPPPACCAALNGVLANGIGVGGLPGILSIQPTYWQVYAMAMAIAVVVPIILTSVVYQRKYRQGTLQIV